MKTVAFFNNKGGVGKTTLVYHLAHMFADLGISVVAADLDPQANLSAMFLNDGKLEKLWRKNRSAGTIYHAFKPLKDGTGDIARAHLEHIQPGLALVAGDLSLSTVEDDLSSQWPLCLDRNARAFRVLSALWRILRRAAEDSEAELVLVDVGPNLGALNRAALVAADFVVVPLAPDLFSLQGLKNLGPTLDDWRAGWRQRRKSDPPEGLDMPKGAMRPIGYVVMQHAVRLDRPVKAYGRWMKRIPGVYLTDVAGKKKKTVTGTADDPHCLAELKHFRSLMPLAQEARKPMFFLKSADGAIGGHMDAVKGCYKEFRDLARAVASRIGIEAPFP